MRKAQTKTALTEFCVTKNPLRVETWRSSHEQSQRHRCRRRSGFPGEHRLGAIEWKRRRPDVCARLRPGTRARRVAMDGWRECWKADRHLGQLLPDPSCGRLLSLGHWSLRCGCRHAQWLASDKQSGDGHPLDPREDAGVTACCDWREAV